MFLYLYFTAERLHDFVVGVTNISSQDVIPAVTNYPICGNYVGAVIAGGTVAFECSLEGRYVVVQIPGNMEILTLCEVEVFGESEYCVCC
jgi:hypothetical protein